jgi:hypothetical protein
VIVRQSDLSTWSRCPLAYRYQNIDKLPRLQSGALSFGSIIHDCVLYMEVNQDLDGALDRFREFWLDPSKLDPEYKIDYYLKNTNWKSYLAKGEKILTDWWALIQWESDVVVGREYEFDVPIGDGHVLHGTVDKLAIRTRPDGERVLLISDYKTNAKLPTYFWLEDNLQFTAYAYASTQPEFWAGMPDGEQIFEYMKDFRRFGEWVALDGPKRMDAGVRDQVQYNRLTYAVNALAESVAMRIFVPNISGDTCRYCEFREQCGLREVE